MKSIGEMSFYETLTAAINDVTKHGYDSPERISYWEAAIRAAALRTLISEQQLEEQLNRFFGATYKKLITDGQILKHHPGVSRGTLENVKPRLRAELDRRRVAAAALIRNDREKMIDDTNRRFTGWASSIPPGGSRAVDRTDVKASVRKSLAALPFNERRVHIDQGHKFVANLNNIIAVDSGAIAGIWHSHFRQINYNYREDHKERDDVFYLVRGNWAINKKFIHVAGLLYTDEITMPGEEVYCRCFYQYLYSLQDIPDEYLTQLGRDALAAARRMIA